MMPRSVTLGAEPIEHAGEQSAVGVVQRAAGRGSPGSTISSPVENSATRTRRRTSSVGQTDRGGERHVLRGEPPAGRQHDRALAHILAGKPAVGASFQPRRHDDVIALGAHVLLHEHRVGAGRHRRAGEDADRLAGADRTRRGAAGGQPSADRKPGFGLGREIAVPHRIAIDGGIVERRQVDRRDHVAPPARARAPR